MVPHGMSLELSLNSRPTALVSASVGAARLGAVAAAGEDPGDGAPCGAAAPPPLAAPGPRAQAPQQSRLALARARQLLH